MVEESIARDSNTKPFYRVIVNYLLGAPELLSGITLGSNHCHTAPSPGP